MSLPTGRDRKRILLPPLPDSKARKPRIRVTTCVTPSTAGVELLHNCSKMAGAREDFFMRSKREKALISCYLKVMLTRKYQNHHQQHHRGQVSSSSPYNVRSVTSPKEEWTFGEASAWMRQHNHIIRTACRILMTFPNLIRDESLCALWDLLRPFLQLCEPEVQKKTPMPSSTSSKNHVQSKSTGLLQPPTAYTSSVIITDDYQDINNSTSCLTPHINSSSDLDVHPHITHVVSQPSSPLPSPPCVPRANHSPMRSRRKPVQVLGSSSFSRDNNSGELPPFRRDAISASKKSPQPRQQSHAKSRGLMTSEMWRAKSTGNVNTESGYNISGSGHITSSRSTESLSSTPEEAGARFLNLPPLRALGHEQRVQGGSHGSLQPSNVNKPPKLLLRRQSSLDSHALIADRYKPNTVSDSPVFKETTYMVCNIKSPKPVELVRFPFQLPASHPASSKDAPGSEVHSVFTSWESESEMSLPLLDTPSMLDLDLRSQSTTPESLDSII